MIDVDIKNKLEKDPDGLLTYEYIANNVDSCDEDMDFLVANMIKVDLSGQFVASAARYLYAIDAAKYDKYISQLKVVRYHHLLCQQTRFCHRYILRVQDKFQA